MSNILFFSFINSVFFVLLSIGCLIGADIHGIFFCLEIFFYIFLVILLLRNIIRNGLTNVYTFFLFFSMFFLFNRFLFDIFGYADVFLITFPSNHKAKVESGILIIVTCFYLYQLFDFGYNSHVKNIAESNANIPLSVYKILIILLLMLLPFVLYKSYLRLRYVQQVGYINYTLNTDDIKLPIYFKGVGWLFNIVFWALIISSQPNRKIGAFWILYLAVSLVDSMKGNRAAFAINLVMYAYFMLNRHKMKPRKILLIMVISFVVFVGFYLLATNLREVSGLDQTVHENSGDFFTKIVIGIFYNQSVSLNIPLLYFDNFEYMLENRFIPFIFSDMLYNNYSIPLTEQVSLLLNVLYTPKGYGLGYCFLLELYDLGVFAIPAAYLIGKFMKFIDKNFWKNTYKIGFFSLFFMAVIYMPRHIILEFLSPIRLSWICGALILINVLKLVCKYGTCRNCH